MLESNSAIMSLDLHANAITDAYESRSRVMIVFIVCAKCCA